MNHTHTYLLLHSAYLHQLRHSLLRQLYLLPPLQLVQLEPQTLALTPDLVRTLELILRQRSLLLVFYLLPFQRFLQLLQDLLYRH